ncbi:hypothetical protein JKP88DRAFT_315438 [Tribonema minus]|uniref:Uncharacterized protein n=1 Tax=Tribonema minus TaxID=303371 RepID=A0A836CFR8_9STRA|nr:hypothetical protein JKP88DRAFT_315438 [Tribonema minus]
MASVCRWWRDACLALVLLMHSVDAGGIWELTQKASATDEGRKAPLQVLHPTNTLDKTINLHAHDRQLQATPPPPIRVPGIIEAEAFDPASGTTGDVNIAHLDGADAITNMHAGDALRYSVSALVGAYTVALRVAPLSSSGSGSSAQSMRWALFLDIPAGAPSPCPPAGDASEIAFVDDAAWDKATKNKSGGSSAQGYVRYVADTPFMLTQAVHTLTLCFNGDAGYAVDSLELSGCGNNVIECQWNRRLKSNFNLKSGGDGGAQARAAPLSVLV